LYAFVDSYGPPWRSRFARGRKNLLLHKRTQRRHGTHKNSRNREGDVALQFGDGQVAPDQSGKISSPVHSRNVYQVPTPLAGHRDSRSKSSKMCPAGLASGGLRGWRGTENEMSCRRTAPPESHAQKHRLLSDASRRVYPGESVVENSANNSRYT